MRRSPTLVLSLAACALVSSLAAEPSAAACHGSDTDGTKVLCFTGLHALVASAAFGPADVAYAGSGRWPSRGWAWPQTLLGGVGTLAGAGVGIALASGESHDPGEDAALAAGLVALGGLHLTFGLGGVLAGDRRRAPSELGWAERVHVVASPRTVAAVVAF